jgi:TonB family protein
MSRRASSSDAADQLDDAALRDEEAGGEPALGLEHRQLDPQLLAQLRDLQQWAMRSRTPEEPPAPAAGPAAAEPAAAETANAERTASERPEAAEAALLATPGANFYTGEATAEPETAPKAPEPVPASAVPREAPPHAAAALPADAKLGASPAAPPLPAAVPPLTGGRRAEEAAPPARPRRRWAAIAALLLLGVIDAYFIARGWRQPVPGAAAPAASEPVASAPDEAAAAPQERGRQASASPAAAPAAAPSSAAVPSAPGPSAAGPSAAAPSAPAPGPAAPQRSASLPSAPALSAPLASAPASPSSAASAPAPAAASSPAPAARMTAPSPQPAWHPAAPVTGSAETPPTGVLAVPPPRTASTERHSSTGDGTTRSAARSHGRHARSELASANAELGPGAGPVRPPVLVSMPPVHYPVVVQRHRISGLLSKFLRRPIAGHRVQVAVLVNRSGHVTTAELRGGGSSPSGFDRAALQAAMAARFRPATSNGVPVKAWAQLTFELAR